MALKVQGDSALNRTTLLGICFNGVLKIEVFQQYEATALLCCLDLASMSCKTSLGSRSEHASCWFICLVASLVHLA
ncbi:hypothetical protein Csa_009912 [Cucumis sativus]|uniref:Uncharacterized protein n=1 Tax=Cucumis sativus TaxID=3659 RepID=A0A0A0LCD7_CUCSA|nr:hypothetical protein Csa_009912 [Cucumis sativus]